MHRTTVTTGAVTAGLAVVGALALAVPAVAGDGSVRSTGDLVRLTQDTVALPEGAAARVHYVSTNDGRTRVTLHVTGFEPGHVYGAHAHTLACDQAPAGKPADFGGPHFQKDPAKGINPANEIWLDLEANASGNGHSVAVQDWAIVPGDGPKSVIIHARSTDPSTGLAGARLACVDVAV